MINKKKNKLLTFFFTLCFLFGMYSEISAQQKQATIDSDQSETPVFPENPPEDWPTYHLLHPEILRRWSADPNCAFYYKGRYHMHYLYPAEGGGGLGMVHVSSKDMVHWKFHPTVLRPANLGHRMLSGTGFFTKEGVPAIIYTNNQDNIILYAQDDQLDSWSDPQIISPKNAEGITVKGNVWDPDCWLDGDTYYAIGGGKNPDLKKSTDLKNWEYIGDLMHKDFPSNLGVTPYDDLSCPNMFRIGDKWMLLGISHALGCRYFIGDFKDGKYLPESHGLMNWEDVNLAAGNSVRTLGTYFAPESLLTPDGRRVMWSWLFHEDDRLQNGVQSLPRELELSESNTLLIKPLKELEGLRYDLNSWTDLIIKNQVDHPLENLRGDALEIEIVFSPLNASYEINKVGDMWHIPTSYGIEVLCDENGENGIPVTVYPSRKTLNIAGVSAPLNIPVDQETVLRVFIDKGIIEVFANDTQAMVYAHKRTHQHANHQLTSFQGNINVKNVRAWKMKSAWKKK